MRDFAELLENLAFAPQRNAKIAVLADYFTRAPDPDRGWAVAALIGVIDLPGVSPARLRALAEPLVDPELFRLSHDHVGDLAETIALVWPISGTDTPSLDEVVNALRSCGPADTGTVLSDLCDRMGPSQRLALLKLVTGGPRPRVSARLVRSALARMSADRPGRSLARIETLWSDLKPPYTTLFEWLEGGDEPDVDLSLALRPLMLASHLDAVGLSTMTPADYAAEWKWDGIRVQALSRGGKRRLYTRSGDDIGAAFPDVIETMTWEGIVDGQLMILRDGVAAPFEDLQRRLGLKRVGRKVLADSPGHLRLFDLLDDGAQDLRPRPFRERRQALVAWHDRYRPARTDLSPEIAFQDWDQLRALLSGGRVAGEEGLMLKRLDAPYEGGRAAGAWFKLKRDPLSADCVLVYAKRGQGAHASARAEFTLAAWRDGPDGAQLVPVARSGTGLPDEEMQELEQWAEANTTERYGPVRAVKPELVLEITFDAVHRSTRHKSGISLRNARIVRIRRDKPAAQADRLSTLIDMIPSEQVL